MKNLPTLKTIFSQLEDENISIYDYKENDKLCGYELNTYTHKGVNQVLFLDFRDTGLNPKSPKDFITVFSNRIADIDTDEEIEINRQNKNYRNSFSIRESLADFEEWKGNLESLVKKIIMLKSMQTFTIEKAFFINNQKINTTEELASYVTKFGKENVCKYMSYAKCIELKDSKHDTETGFILWAFEDGSFISESGYHYDIDCFL